MRYVYATAYNVKKALSSMETDSVEIGAATVRDMILTKNLFLSSLDITTLKTLHFFLENPSVFISKYFRGWKDEVKFLIEEPPAYHINPDCEWFHKDFYNIEIPSKIKKRDLVKESRDWAKSNRELITPQTIDKFCELFMEYFNHRFEVGLTRDDLVGIKRLNSGIQIVNSNLTSLEKEIKKILELVNQKFDKKQQHFFDREFREKNYKYCGEYKNSGAYAEYKLYWDLHFWRYSVVKPLVKNIEDYVFLKLNQDHKYQQTVLDFLKFRPCMAKDCT